MERLSTTPCGELIIVEVTHEGHIYVVNLRPGYLGQSTVFLWNGHNALRSNSKLARALLAFAKRPE